MEKKLDRRVKYTIMMLKDALVELMQKEHISKISVKALCERADVNRSTFYAHFEDQYDLLHSIEQEAMDNITHYLSRQDYTDNIPVSFQVLNRILVYVKENAGLFRALLSDNGGSNIQKDILKVPEIFDFQIYNSQGERTKEYLAVFAITGCVSILQKWLEDGTPESTETISDLVLQVLYKGITSFR
ncbi:TetR/AcrR family transcriptional regulator [Christensenellaceae bacterium OttesenSCG-928-K19]|nr:TetR/AcrR family transcriptional regulator [Christensenellaceae bacterium OttesenSCG-928-K19]